MSTVLMRVSSQTLEAKTPRRTNPLSADLKMERQPRTHGNVKRETLQLGILNNSIYQRRRRPRDDALASRV